MRSFANIREELSEQEREVLAADGARWKQLGAGQHLDDWLAFGPGLMIRRQLAMKLAHSNKPEGRRYSEAFNLLMRQDGLDSIPKGAISAILWLHDPERRKVLDEIRAEMTDGERARLNSPITARQRVETAIKAAKTETPPPPKASLRTQLADKDRKIDMLTARLQEAEAAADAGSLFDLKSDTADDIASAIVANVSSSKASSIAKAIKEKMKAKALAPAG